MPDHAATARTITAHIWVDALLSYHVGDDGVLTGAFLVSTSLGGEMWTLDELIDRQLREPDRRTWRLLRTTLQAGVEQIERALRDHGEPVEDGAAPAPPAGRGDDGA